MESPSSEFLIITVDLFGALAGAALALPENNDRRLLDSAEPSSTPHRNVRARRNKD